MPSAAGITRLKQWGQIGMLMRCGMRIVALLFSVVERVFGCSLCAISIWAAVIVGLLRYLS